MVQLGKRPNTSTSSTRAGGDPGSLPPLPADRRRDRPTAKILPLNPRGQANRPGSESELRDELSGMAASLTEVDPRAAERLQDLADAIETEAGRLRWADVDLRRAFNTDHLAHAYAV